MCYRIRSRPFFCPGSNFSFSPSTIFCKTCCKGRRNDCESFSCERPKARATNDAGFDFTGQAKFMQGRRRCFSQATLGEHNRKIDSNTGFYCQQSLTTFADKRRGKSVVARIFSVGRTHKMQTIEFGYSMRSRAVARRLLIGNGLFGNFEKLASSLKQTESAAETEVLDALTLFRRAFFAFESPPENLQPLPL